MTIYNESLIKKVNYGVDILKFQKCYRVKLNQLLNNLTILAIFTHKQLIM